MGHPHAAKKKEKDLLLSNTSGEIIIENDY